MLQSVRLCLFFIFVYLCLFFPLSLSLLGNDTVEPTWSCRRRKRGLFDSESSTRMELSARPGKVSVHHPGTTGSSFGQLLSLIICPTIHFLPIRLIHRTIHPSNDPSNDPSMQHPIIHLSIFPAFHPSIIQHPIIQLSIFPSSIHRMTHPSSTNHPTSKCPPIHLSSLPSIK